jgi:hypothetical protein
MVLGMRFANEKEARDFLAKCKSLSSSVVNYSKSGFKSSTQEEILKRKSICERCEDWNSSAWNGTGKCKLCGCSTWAKIRIATERCPIGKWEVAEKTLE